MLKRYPFGNTFVVTLAVLLASAGFAEPPPSAQRCFGCHSESGVTDHPEIPSLAGASPFYLENQLNVFEAGARPCRVETLEEEIDKCALVSSLNEAQKSALAEYFSGKTFGALEQEFDPALADQGAVVHEARCERCHSDSGREPLDDAGLLAGQPIAYLTRQLVYFIDGRRWQPKSMAPQTGSLDAREIDALAHFYARAGLEARAD